MQPALVVQSPPIVLLQPIPKLVQLFPHAHEMELYGRRVFAIPHGMDEVRVLRNAGVRVKSPIETRYPFYGPYKQPFDIQVKTAAFLTLHKRGYVLNQLGTGKTASALWAAEFLMRERVLRTCLILCPLSTIRVVWEAEIFKLFGTAWPVTVLHGSRSFRRSAIQRKVPGFYILNHEGLVVFEDETIKDHNTKIKSASQRKAPRVIDELASLADLVILDECGSFRMAGTLKYKLMRSIARRDVWLWGMTGGPTPNAPTDAYGQARLVTPDQLAISYEAFRELTMVCYNSRWIPREGSQAHVAELLQPSVRFKRSDSFDLPPCVYINRECAMSGEQAKAYRQMQREAKLELATGKCTAVNEAVKRTKLLEISSGFVYGDGGSVRRFNPAARLAVLDELLDEVDGKVLIFSIFDEAVDIVAEHVRKRWPPGGVMQVGGSCKPKGRARDDIFFGFQQNDKLRAIVAHPRTMAHGLTLTEASTIIWYTLHDSNDIYEQACHRIIRSGQKRAQVIAHILASPADRVVANRLRNRSGWQGALLEILNTEL